MALNKKMIPKVFGKDIYLLGVDSNGQYYWLEAPSWDCDWYWGFGYVETYTNNKNPAKSKDVSSHQHWDSIVNGDIKLIQTTFGGRKAIMFDLFRQFYALKKEAESLHKSPIQANTDRYELINKRLIPGITKQILDILTPTK